MVGIKRVNTTCQIKLFKIDSILKERYQIIRKIAKGAMGIVYEARDLQTGNTVAIKTFFKNIVPAEELDRFRREISILEQLDHPHITHIVDSCCMNGGINTYFLVLEYVKGGSLSDRIKKHGKETESNALGLIMQLTAAVGHFHGKNIIHRDIKPGNILMKSADFIKLTDFGLSKYVGPKKGLTDIEKSLTGHGKQLGTRYYMSPEQATGDIENLKPNTDIYSIGAIFFLLLTGVDPIIELTPEEKNKVEQELQATLIANPNLRAKHSESSIRDIIENLHLAKKAFPFDRIPNLHPLLKQILKRMTENDTSQRYQNCKELMRDLKAAQLFMAGEKSEKAKAFTNAIKYYEESLCHSALPETFRRKGLCHVKMEQWEKAIECYKKSTSKEIDLEIVVADEIEIEMDVKDPEFALAFRMLGRQFIESDPGKAIEYFDEAIKLGFVEDRALIQERAVANEIKRSDKVIHIIFTQDDYSNKKIILDECEQLLSALSRSSREGIGRRIWIDMLIMPLYQSLTKKINSFVSNLEGARKEQGELATKLNRLLGHKTKFYFIYPSLQEFFEEVMVKKAEIDNLVAALVAPIKKDIISKAIELDDWLIRYAHLLKLLKNFSSLEDLFALSSEDRSILVDDKDKFDLYKILSRNISYIDSSLLLKITIHALDILLNQSYPIQEAINDHFAFLCGATRMFSDYGIQSNAMFGMLEILLLIRAQNKPLFESAINKIVGKFSQNSVGIDRIKHYLTWKDISFENDSLPKWISELIQNDPESLSKYRAIQELCVDISESFGAAFQANPR